MSNSIGAATDEDSSSTGPTLPTVTVVMSTYNRAEIAERAVAAALDQHQLHELIVIDDGSADDTAVRLQRVAKLEPKLRFLTSPNNIGRVAARSLGLSEATGEVVLLLDDDVIAGPDLIRGHALHHASADDLVVVGYMPVDDSGRSSPISSIYATEYESVVEKYRVSNAAVLTNLWGGNVSIRHENLLRIGLSSPDFPSEYHEDQDFGMRCRAAGLNGIFDERLAARHCHTRSLDGFLSDAYNRGAALVLLQEVHGEANSAHFPGLAIFGNARVESAARKLLKPLAGAKGQLAIPALKVLRRLAQYRGALDRTNQVASQGVTR